MIETKGNSLLAISGIDQQDIEQVQLVQGAFPFQVGLQQRIPGKTLLLEKTSPIGSIYVFYMVHGRFYTIVDYGTIEIIPTPIPHITLPGLPPTLDMWFDAFDYDPGTISRIWGGGLWDSNPGVCESLIHGVFDPYRTGGTPPPGGPAVLPPPVEPPGPPGGEGVPGGETAGATPSPPPDPYHAGDCADLPSGAYETLAISHFFTSVEQVSATASQTISVPNATTFAPWLPVGAYTHYGTAFTADQRKYRSATNDGFGSFNSTSSDTIIQVNARFVIPDSDEWPRGTRFFLVGSKTLSNGVMGAFNNPVEVTSCAMLEFAVEGESFGNMNLQTLVGPFAVTTPPTGFFNVETTMGQVSFSSVRVYVPVA